MGDGRWVIGRKGGTVRTRYAICGLSSRALGMYALPLLGDPRYPQYGDYSAHGELVGLLDLDRERLEAFPLW